MDNVDDRGDLGDVVRAGGSTTAPSAGAGSTLRGVLFDAGWSQLPPEPAGFPPTWGASVMDDFGDPFCSFEEEHPLLHELAGAFMSFDSSKPAVSGLIEMVTPAAGNDAGGTGSAPTAGSSGGSTAVRQKAVTAGGVVMMRPSCGIFSVDEAAAASMTVSPRRIRPTRAVFCAGDMAVKVNAGSAAGAPDEEGLHMPSTRSILGIKSRRKGAQEKKVVSIPAPAAAGGKPRGGAEAVPPDLWAWRKYGQKPIKGSPYPRSYYRCSSSKGCPARKQVERSRTDAGMLVISYTSGHNHPWPTHRNALAGTTRTSQQPTAKNSSPSAAPTSSSHDQANLPYSTVEDVSKEGACSSQANHGRQQYYYFSRRERSSTIEGTGVDEEGARRPPPAEGMYERPPVHSYRRLIDQPPREPAAEPSDVVDDLFAGLGSDHLES